jgi:dTDP-4-amino-4,6-dideoxygalactose transaminase
MNVPFLDLKAQYAAIKNEIHAAIGEVMENTAFAGGPFVARFEQEFARFCNCKHAVGVGNGTDALWLSLLSLGIGPGDEVITVPDTFIATAEAITYCGATPVFVDVDPKTYNMDPNKLEDCLKKRLSPNASRLTPRPKAIIPVHLFGQTADMDPILAIAGAHGLHVVEDACQAHGAEYKGRKAGSMGATGCFSFYPGKNLGAYGEAGAVVTNDDAIAEKIRMFRDHGQSKKYYHGIIGWNARMDGIQGAVLSVKLKYLAGWNEARREHAREYTRLLSPVEGVSEPREADYAKHVFHIYAIRTGRRDKLMAHLGERGISCGIHYPVPIHLQKAYHGLGLAEGSFPVAEKCAEEFLSLPMFPELTTGQIAYVVDTLKLFLAPAPALT